MNDRFLEIENSIFAKHPKSSLEKVSPGDLEKYKESYPGLPDSYWTFLEKIGWGRIGDMGYAIYSCPFEPEEIFGEEQAEAHLKDVLLIGDDFSGGHEAFRKDGDNWKLVSFDHCDLDGFVDEKLEFHEYVYDRFIEENI